MNLIREWANWTARKAPFFLKSDKKVLLSERNARRIVKIRSWQQAHRAEDFCALRDSRLHLGLLPQPFLGDLRRASIYILGLNPGVGPGDYYAECEVPQFRKALLLNLKQKFKLRSFPFLFLDPHYAWHGGFAWWHGKLAKVISYLAEEAWHVSFAQARRRLAGTLASIELVPYHSSKSPGGWIRLESVRLARAYVNDKVVPRVRRGQAIAIAIRQAKIWELPEETGFVSYTRQEARAASLSPKTRGGKAILRYLSNLRANTIKGTRSHDQDGSSQSNSRGH